MSIFTLNNKLVSNDPRLASKLPIGIQKILNNNEQMLTSVYPNKTNLQTYLYKSLLNKTLYCCKINVLTVFIKSFCIKLVI